MLRLACVQTSLFAILHVMEHDGQLWPWKWKLIDKLAHVRTGRTSCPTRKNLPASNLHRMSSVAPRVHPWKMTLKIIEIKLSPYLRVNRGWKGKIRWLITCRASHTRTGRSRSLFFRLSRLSMAGFPWLRFRWALRGREYKMATIFKFVPKQCVHAVGFLR